MPFTDADKAELKTLFAEMVTDALTPEALGSAITPVVQKSVSGAVADHLKRAGVSKDTLAGLTSKIEALEAREPAGGGEEPPPGDDGKNKSGKSGGKTDDVQVRSLAKQIEDMRKEVEASKQREQQAIQKSRDSQRRTKLAETLAAAGVTDPIRIKHAAKYLDDRVVYDEEDPETLTFIADDGQKVTLDVGIKSWAKTEDGKHYLPPAGVRGSGSRPGGSNPGADDKQAKKDAVWVAAAEELLKR